MSRDKEGGVSIIVDFSGVHPTLFLEDKGVD